MFYEMFGLVTGLSWCIPIYRLLSYNYLVTVRMSYHIIGGRQVIISGLSTCKVSIVTTMGIDSYSWFQNNFICLV